MKAKTLTILLLSISALLYSQDIHEIWNVDGLNTYVLIGGENMDDDPAEELVYVEHLAGQYNPRIVIFDGITGQVDYDTGPGIQNNYNVAGFNWTTQTGSDINIGRNALFDLDGDGIFELVYNLNGITIEAVGFDGSNIDILWAVNDLDTFVLIGADQMDADPALELVFVNHIIGGQIYSPRIVIFDGSNGAVDYDTGPGLQNHYNVAGFNWTTTIGSDINTGMDALHDLNNDGMYELVYNLNGQLNEAVGYDGNDIGILWSVDALGTFVLIGAEQMDNDAAKEIVFLNHLIGAVNYNPRFVIFDGANGSVDYDTGPGLANHYNVAGFNWTTTDGSNYNAGFKALHDVDSDGLFELAYNISGQTNEVLGFDGADLGVIWSVDGLGTAVLIGSGQMDEDPPLELVFLQHVTGAVNFNSRFVIFDGLSGLVEYDTGPGQQDHYNVAGFNWTTSSGSNINTGFKALYDIDGLGLDELVYNRNGQTNEVVGFDGGKIDILAAFNSLGTHILAGAAQMDTDGNLELVFVEHTETAPAYNPRFIIFNGMAGDVDYDTGPGTQNNYNVAGFNWTTMAGFNINTGWNPLFDVDNNGRYEMAFNINGSNNVLIGWDLMPGIFGPEKPDNGMVSIYPNPNTGIFDLQFTVYNLQRIGIKIFDLNGKELMTVVDKELLPGDHTIKVDTKDLPAGFYIYRVLNAADQLIGFGKVVIM